MNKSERQAASLFRRFTGHEPAKVGKIPNIQWPKEGVAIGRVLEIRYLTIRNGREEAYSHPFGKHARPLLIVSPDGRMVLMLGGAFRFTERGFVDAPKR